MVTVALILLGAVLAALLLATWQTLRARTAELAHATRRADRYQDLADGYLLTLRECGLVNAVDTCQRTRERAK